MLLLRDYEYIDVARITDYLSSVDPGVANELTQRIKSNTGVNVSGGINIQAFKLGGGARKGDESEVQQTIRVYAQHMFSRLYDEVQKAGAIQTVDLDTPLEMDGLSRSSVLEVTRDFRPSPLHQMLDSFTGIVDRMKSLGMESELGDEANMEQIMRIVGWLRGEEGSNEVPMFSKADEDGDASVVFVARENFVLGMGTEFRGEMTLFGKVQELVPAGSSIDLIDLLKVLPPGVRGANGFGGTLKDAIHDFMGEWPKELGGPIERDEVVVQGPAVVVTPVAAYTV
ncbi:hypothetical protein GBA63_07450 [Rubrobacter tropicus]|uniref:Uncharacterized protein n=1 Tax=Rubrobacter tropicus TaxID=2653851 RepID=A0A6G8Q856_9ACTN|nr:hypothetical protein [Rubrobacter tropicus]QIN82497.1 hypothetical protein GBA63_07450 [Rubrobacter tropicus]